MSRQTPARARERCRGEESGRRPGKFKILRTCSGYSERFRSFSSFAGSVKRTCTATSGRPAGSATRATLAATAGAGTSARSAAVSASHPVRGEAMRYAERTYTWLGEPPGSASTGAPLISGSM